LAAVGGWFWSAAVGGAFLSVGATVGGATVGGVMVGRATVGGLRRFAAVYNGQIKTPPIVSAAFRVGGWRRFNGASRKPLNTTRQKRRFAKT